MCRIFPRFRPDKKVVPIPAKAGSIIIWNNLLLHGNGRNVGDRPRFSQYISMFPADRLTEENRQHRIECWQHRLPPGGTVFPGDPREIEQKEFQTAELTPLGPQTPRPRSVGMSAEHHGPAFIEQTEWK